MKPWRLVKQRHDKTAFEREGAGLHGVAVIYVAGTLAVAALETFVHP